MKRKKILLTMLIAAVVCLVPFSVKAWVAAGVRGVGWGRYGAGCYHGAYGGTAAWGYGRGYASGCRGAASWGYGSGSAVGRYGGSASWSHGYGTATGRYGGTASWGGGSGSYHGAYGRSVSWAR